MLLSEILSEAAIRQYKRSGNKIIPKYRCLSGKKKGKLVSEPSKCGQRKDPKRVRIGKKVMKAKKGTIQRKGRVSKRRQISKIIQRANQRLQGK